MHTTRNKSERPRRKNDYYPTPYGLARAALAELVGDEHLPVHHALFVLDAGCGKGVWMDAMLDVGSAINQEVGVVGMDLEPAHRYAMQGDFLDYVPPIRFDLVMGNPPYNLMEQFVRHSLESDVLNPNGLVFFLCRLEFLASKDRCFGLFRDHPLHKVYILARRPSFFSTNGHRTTDAQDYAMFLWKKTPDNQPSQLGWLYWDYHPVHDIITEIDVDPTKKAMQENKNITQVELATMLISNPEQPVYKQFRLGEVYKDGDIVTMDTVFVDLDDEQN